MSTGMYRGFRWGLGVLALMAAGVVVSGAALLLTREPDSQWTTLAQRGSDARPTTGLAEPLQDIHITLTTLFALAVFVYVAWLVGVVMTDWSWEIVLVFVGLGVAVISGWQAGFLAVSVDGMYRGDLTGYGFVFDSGFDNVLDRGGQTGPTTFRVWTAVHVLVLPAMAALLVRGIRRWRES